MRLEGENHNRPAGMGGEKSRLGEQLLVRTMDPVEVTDRQHRLLKRRIDRLETIKNLHRDSPATWNACTSSFGEQHSARRSLWQSICPATSEVVDR